MIYIFFSITVLALFLTLYVYLGYPVLLVILDKILKGKPLNISPITPKVSMIISCYNEVDVIEKKINDCLAIDYPEDLIEFIFVSDGSSDGTDEIIKKYVGERVRLVRQEGRLGKTMGLNLAMKQAEGEIIVFSDANAMYKSDAIRMLTRNFYDENVGYVVGAAIYRDEKESVAGSSENAYWKYEIFIKKIESKLHSVVGGDGAIYAIRKKLYKEMKQEDINDFVNPLQIIGQGYRGIFDEEAICFEHTAGDFDKEGSRKKRIVNRSFTGLMNNSSVLNPFKSGFFALEIWSHKLLRWLVPFFLIVASVGTVVLSQYEVLLFQVFLLLGIIFTWFVLLGYWLKSSNFLPSLFLFPYYFYLVNYNSLLGVLQSLQGHVQVTWSTPRDKNSESGGFNLKIIIMNTFLIAVSLVLFFDTLYKLGI